MKKITLLLLVGFIAARLHAQDHLYSQFYNAPTYLNPALSGQFEGDFRVNMIYRNQWTNIPGPLNYYTFSADMNLPEVNSGVGLMFTKASQGTAYLNKINVAGIYTYNVNFENAVLSFGLQAGVTNNKVDVDKLVYLDQLNASGIIPGGASAAGTPEFNNKFFFDGGAGINLVVGDLMLGAAGQHINKPNESLTGITSPLPMRINAYASYKLILNHYFDDSPSLIPSMVYYQQAGVSSFSAGMQYKTPHINIGLWYRGTGQQNDAVVVSVIFDLSLRNTFDKLRFGLSHDATTSNLQYYKTAGTTEGALGYETTFPNHQEYDYRRTNSARCYDFY